MVDLQHPSTQATTPASDVSNKPASVRGSVAPVHGGSVAPRFNKGSVAPAFKANAETQSKPAEALPPTRPTLPTQPISSAPISSGPSSVVQAVKPAQTPVKAEVKPAVPSENIFPPKIKSESTQAKPQKLPVEPLKAKTEEMPKKSDEIPSGQPASGISKSGMYHN